MTPAEIHNRDAGSLICQIIGPTLKAGGKFTDVLVLLESVVAGVLLVGVKDGGDEIVLEVLAKHVKERLAEVRLRRAEPEGNA